MAPRTLQVRSLHRVTYENGMRMQELLVAMRQKHEIPDQLLLLEHPPVITLGRGGDSANLLAPSEELRQRGVRFYETTRGGDITYHGPGQLVGYPIIHLGEGSRDVRKYVTKLEEVLIRAAADFAITAARIDGKHGIWVGSDKLAAIGVRIARWVTSHGFALNVDPDLGHFDLITPCGLEGSGVTSIARLTGRRPDMENVRAAVARHFEEVFGFETQDEKESLQLVKVVVHDGAGRALLLHRRPARGDFWQPVTGTIEPRESPAEAAGRELREETGCVAEPAAVDLCQSFIIESKFLEQTLKPPIVAREWLFTSELGSDGEITIDEEEHDDYGWFTFTEAYEKIRWSDDRDSLEAVEHMTQYPSPRVSGERG